MIERGEVSRCESTAGRGEFRVFDRGVVVGVLGSLGPRSGVEEEDF
jgi:hypothetical protein